MQKIESELTAKISSKIAGVTFYTHPVHSLVLCETCEYNNIWISRFNL